MPVGRRLIGFGACPSGEKSITFEYSLRDDFGILTIAALKELTLGFPAWCPMRRLLQIFSPAQVRHSQMCRVS